MTKYIAIDLDGCVSDDSWRLNKIDHSITDLDERYHAYNIACGQDRPIKQNIDLIAKMLQMTGAYPVVITARPDYVRSQTEAWIKQHCPFTVAPYCLVMRPEDNHTHSPELKAHLLSSFVAVATNPEVIAFFDDREDVVNYLSERGVNAIQLGKPAPRFDERHVNEVDFILQSMAETFRERNAVYGNNYKMVAPLVSTLFENSMDTKLVTTDQWHLFELILVKLSRFAISGLEHVDSIHDIAVYAAMIESIIKKSKEIPR